ncbi:hypothetical protein [Mastigocoleus testarum]|uniref:hypothetical protein n=1 Tax=Mastigocoleus testarum TaxID=996925 RepID=UPI00137AB100|nr:hypothetical protein [Mastigocoleus testarum]
MSVRSPMIKIRLRNENIYLTDMIYNHPPIAAMNRTILKIIKKLEEIVRIQKDL